MIIYENPEREKLGRMVQQLMREKSTVAVGDRDTETINRYRETVAFTETFSTPRHRRTRDRQPRRSRTAER